MKRTFDRKVYDTKTALYLGERVNEHPPGTSYHVRETLYMTPGEQFFLHALGGPRTHYAEYKSDAWDWGETLVPITRKMAAEFAKAYLPPHVQDILDVQRAPSSDLATRVRRNFSISPVTDALLDRATLNTGIPRSRLVDDAIQAMYGEFHQP